MTNTNERPDSVGGLGPSRCSSDLMRKRKAVDFDRKHCESMLKHYERENVDKWLYWHGRKKVCDEVIAEIDEEMAGRDDNES